MPDIASDSRPPATQVSLHRHRAKATAASVSETLRSSTRDGLQFACGLGRGPVEAGPPYCFESKMSDLFATKNML